jgi:hypothetical protein
MGHDLTITAAYGWYSVRDADGRLLAPPVAEYADALRLAKQLAHRRPSHRLTRNVREHTGQSQDSTT